jgi:hypothetical protein
MSYHIVLWLLFCVLLITFSIVRKKRNKRLNAILWALIIIVFIGQTFFPRQLFGKWNSISKLNGKKITEILLQPSEPNWEVNLAGKDFIISNKKQIDTIINLLQNVEVYFPGHPSRIWESKMIFISSQKDSFEIKIHQTENNGTVIYTSTNEWRKDAIGDYLAKLISYRKPAYSDTSTTRF